MDQFIEFLLSARNFANTVDFAKTKIHIVLGNESCDLDSMICALALAYYYFQESVKKSIDYTQKVVLPILNIPQNEFALRSENVYILKQLNIDENHLIFRDTLNLEEIQCKGLLSVTIVDHHILRAKDTFLERCVIEVFDHRPQNPNMPWDLNKTNVVMDEVGSCTTLIGDKLLRADFEALNGTLAGLLYDVITFDTIAFNPKAEKVREFDINVAGELQRQFNLSINAQERFEELWQAHNDVSHLTAKQLLFKDVKFVKDLPIAGLPMLVYDYLKLPNVESDLVLFCDEVNSSTAVIIGLTVVNETVYRDIAVFAKDDKCLQNALVTSLIEASDLRLEETEVSVPNTVYFKQNNISKSRKQILPIIEAVIVPR